MRNSEKFTDLFNRSFQYLDSDNANKDEQEVIDNLSSSRWTLIKSFQVHEFIAISSFLGIISEAIHIEDLVLHHTDNIKLLIYKDRLSNKQSKWFKKTIDKFVNNKKETVANSN
jgi:hypothetical protein